MIRLTIEADTSEDLEKAARLISGPPAVRIDGRSFCNAVASFPPSRSSTRGSGEEPSSCPDGSKTPGTPGGL